MGTNSQLIAAGGSGTGGISTALTIVLAILGSSVLAGVLGTILGNSRANAAARRDRYAQVVRYMVAWNEYPYRIRRRTDDQPATLTALADRGHALQEQLGESRAWVAGESRALSSVLDRCLRDLSAIVGPACVDAWQQPPSPPEPKWCWATSVPGGRATSSLEWNAPYPTASGFAA